MSVAQPWRKWLEMIGASSFGSSSSGSSSFGSSSSDASTVVSTLSNEESSESNGSDESKIDIVGIIVPLSVSTHRTFRPFLHGQSIPLFPFIKGRITFIKSERYLSLH